MQRHEELEADVPPSYEPEEDDVEALIRVAGADDVAGSAKVSLICIERSIGAWTAIRLAHPETADAITPPQRLLGWLRVTTDRLVPDARTFHRPGFDDA